MASTRSRIIVPTTAALAHSLRLPSTNQRVLKTLGRVARDSLLELVLDWLDDEEQSRCGPYLLQEDGQDGQDSVYPPATSLEEVKQVYLDFQSKKGLKREVVDRMTEGDWVGNSLRSGHLLRNRLTAPCSATRHYPVSTGHGRLAM